MHKQISRTSTCNVQVKSMAKCKRRPKHSVPCVTCCPCPIVCVATLQRRFLRICKVVLRHK